MPTLTSLVNTRVGGQDSILELDDANGVQYVIEADSTLGQLIVKRAGTTVAGFGSGGSAFRKVEAKAASYTVVAADSGKLFTTTGASGAITFTLPAVAGLPTGWFAEFYNTVDQNMVITAPAGLLVGTHSAASTTVTFSTASEKIGAGARVTFDGTKYLLQMISASEIVTPTLS